MMRRFLAASHNIMDGHRAFQLFPYYKTLGDGSTHIANSLPRCMRERVLVVDIELNDWFTKAMCEAHEISSRPFVPSRQAFEVFDENEAMKRACELLYQDTNL